ncbi:MAG: hypothetical protein NZL90_04985 [Aquificaceae bacterium]|nr:hypothetical protein [Aquificaceae bacterium]MDW8237759.1 hypothetical protein [Aquificaceae bacterium]
MLYLIFLINKRTQKALLSLGAKDVKNHIFWSSGYIQRGGVKAKLDYAINEYQNRLVLTVPSSIKSFLIFRKKDFLNSVLYPKSVGFAKVEYDDAKSFNKITSNQEFISTIKSCFNQSKLYSIEFRDGLLSVVFFLQKRESPSEEDVKSMLRIADKINSLNLSISDQVKTHRYRSLLGFYAPNVFVPLLFIFSILFLPSKKYPYVCPIESYVYGAFWVFLALALYLFFVFGQFANLSNILSSIFKLYVVYIIAIYLPFSLIPFINGYFDTSSPEYKTDAVVKKVLTENGYKIKLASKHPLFCGYIDVPPEFFNSVKVGDEISYASRSGALKLQWFEQESLRRNF